MGYFNGNVGTSKEYGYLIIGPDDQLIGDTREIHPLEPHLAKITSKKVLEKINNLVEPTIPDIKIENIVLSNGKTVMVFELQPLPFLIKLIRDLRMKEVVEDSVNGKLEFKITKGDKLLFPKNSIILRNNESIVNGDHEHIKHINTEKENIFGKKTIEVLKLLSFYDRALFYAPVDSENVFEMFYAIYEIRRDIQKNIAIVSDFKDVYESFNNIVKVLFETETNVVKINPKIATISKKLKNGKKFYELKDFQTLREQIPSDEYSQALNSMHRIRFEIDREVRRIREAVSFA